MWAITTDGVGNQHKVKRQKLQASCVPACMAMIARSVSTTSEGYDEENARTHLRSVMPDKSGSRVFNEVGIGFKYVADALHKIKINTAVFKTIAINATNLQKFFTLQKPGIVGATLSAGNVKHALVCKGEIAPGTFLFICPAYGPHEVAAGSAGAFALTDRWLVGLPNTTATLTGDIVTLV